MMGTPAGQVFDHHLKAFSEGDIDGIVSDYADDAVLITNDQVAHGKRQIRKTFEAFLLLFPPGTKFDLFKRVDEEEVVYVQWNGGSRRCRVDFGTDTFRIVDGKIVLQTVALQMQVLDA